MTTNPPALRFTVVDAERAYDEWGCNCGPAAIAAIFGLTLNALRPHLGDFEAKGYTNPTLMREIMLRMAPCAFDMRGPSYPGERCWPWFGLARIQWDGPWCKPGVPARAAYRHTHWVGSCLRAPGDVGIFDVNAMASGGWIALRDWSDTLVPWLLKQVVPRASGKWWITHTIEVKQ